MGARGLSGALFGDGHGEQHQFTLVGEWTTARRSCHEQSSDGAGLSCDASVVGKRKRLPKRAGFRHRFGRATLCGAGLQPGNARLSRSHLCSGREWL